MRAPDEKIQQVLDETPPKNPRRRRRPKPEPGDIVYGGGSRFRVGPKGGMTPLKEVDKHAIALLEFTSRDLIQGVDWDFINMRKHYDEARRRGVRYVPYDSSNPQKGSNGQYIFFKSPLSPKSKKRGYKQDAWYQTIRMMDFKDAMEQTDLSFRDRINLAVSGDLQVHCTGPAFNWWGYRYIVAQLDTGLYPQEIRPNVRNPSRRGTVCKHLATVLRVLPFWMSDINRDLRLQGFDPEQEEEQERET